MKDQKGFTLVELTVAMVILTTLIVLSGSILLSSTDLFGRNALMNDEQMIADGVSEFMEDQMVYATKLKVATSDVSSYQRALKIEGGHLMFRSENTTGFEDIMGEDFYNTYSVNAITNADTANGVMKLTIEVMDDGGETVYKTTSTMNLINISRLGKGGFDSPELDQTNLIISYSYKDVVKVGDPIIIEMQEHIAEFTEAYENLKQQLAAIDATPGMNYGQKQNAKRALYRPFFGDNQNNALLSNDRIRNYIKNHYYTAGWPVFEKSRFISLNEGANVRYYQYLNCANYQINPYFVSDSGEIKYVTFYVHPEGGNWGLQLAYHVDEGCWYCYVQDTGRPFIRTAFTTRSIAGGASVLNGLMDEIENDSVDQTAYPGAFWMKLEE